MAKIVLPTLSGAMRIFLPGRGKNIYRQADNGLYVRESPDGGGTYAVRIFKIRRAECIEI